MYEFADLLFQKRRFFFVVAAVAIELVLSSVLGATVQSHRATIEARIRATDNGQSTQIADNSPNLITNALSQLADDIGGGSATAEAKLLRGTVTLSEGLTRMNTDVGHGVFATAMFTYHGARAATLFTVHGVSATTMFIARSEIRTFRFGGHVLHTSLTGTTDATGTGFDYIGSTISDTLGFNVHMAGDVVGFAYGVTHVGSVIRPSDATPVPIITQLRAQQAAIIQSGTQGVSVAALTSGSGGVCDAGDGNGGYPMGWCNAPIDTVSTVPYTRDLINRECTSYAYWYFTEIEGHTNFQVWDDAKYWADTSNYPSHALPVVGAIAVETAGAYGHVAIVQALPGQTYAGQAVPAGYLLVSEMNYDWQGHFRYSYSPLSKFSAYIY